jgi:hypothetical protein
VSIYQKLLTQISKEIQRTDTEQRTPDASRNYGAEANH